MANVDCEIAELRAAVLESDIRGSINVPASVTIKDNTLTSTAVQTLRPGQGILAGPETFTIESVNTATGTATLNRRTEIPGSSAGAEITHTSFYTDSNLFNLKNVDGVDVFSIDNTGTIIQHNGVPVSVVTDTVSLAQIKQGVISVSGDVKLSFTASQLGRANTLHRVVILNTAAAPVVLKDTSDAELKTLAVGINQIFIHIQPAGTLKAY